MKRRISGLSLLELLIALAVIAIVFLALASGQITSLRTTAGARDIADAKTFANRQMESVRKGIIVDVLNATDSQAQWDTYYGFNCPDSLCKNNISSNGYSAFWEIKPDDTTRTVANEGLVQISMKIDWDRGGQTGILNIVDYVGCAEILLTLCPDGTTGKEFFDPDP